MGRVPGMGSEMRVAESRSFCPTVLHLWQTYLLGSLSLNKSTGFIIRKIRCLQREVRNTVFSVFHHCVSVLGANGCWCMRLRQCQGQLLHMQKLLAAPYYCLSTLRPVIAAKIILYRVPTACKPLIQCLERRFPYQIWTLISSSGCCRSLAFIPVKGVRVWVIPPSVLLCLQIDNNVHVCWISLGKYFIRELQKNCSEMVKIAWQELR